MVLCGRDIADGYGVKRMASLALTESNMLAALRAVLLSLIGSGTEVIEGEINRIAEPVGPDFVVMIPITRERLSTNVDTYADIPSAGVKRIAMPTAVTVQIDVHGPNSADNSAIIAAVFRDETAADGLALSGFDIAPLYTSEPRQTPFINAEQQVEFRWAIDLTLQVNPIITIAQDFADHLAVVLTGVNTTYGPARLDFSLPFLSGLTVIL